jgi:hypothetical protein
MLMCIIWCKTAIQLAYIANNIIKNHTDRAYSDFPAQCTGHEGSTSLWWTCWRVIYSHPLNNSVDMLKDNSAIAGFSIFNLVLVLLQSGPEPWFGLDFWSSSPWFSPWFSHQPELDCKMVLSSRSTWTVLFWFGLPKPFRTPTPTLLALMSDWHSGFAFLVGQAAFSLFEGKYTNFFG